MRHSLGTYPPFAVSRSRRSMVSTAVISADRSQHLAVRIKAIFGGDLRWEHRCPIRLRLAETLELRGWGKHLYRHPPGASHVFTGSITSCGGPSFDGSEESHHGVADEASYAIGMGLV